MGTPDYIIDHDKIVVCSCCNAPISYLQTKDLGANMDMYLLQGGRLTFAGSAFHSARVVRTAPISGRIRVTGMCKGDSCTAPEVQTLYMTLRNGEILDMEGAT